MRRRMILDFGFCFVQMSSPDPLFLFCPVGRKTLGTTCNIYCQELKGKSRELQSLKILQCGKRLDQWDFNLFYCPLLSLLANLSLKLRRFFTLFPDFLRTRPTGSRTSSTTTGSLASRLSRESSINKCISCGEKFLSSACTKVTTSSVTSCVGSSGADWLTETTFVVMNTSCCLRERRGEKRP